MRTVNVRNIWTCDVAWHDNGAFTVELTHGAGPKKDTQRVVLHFDAFWWVSSIADGLWAIVKRRREQLASEIKRAEDSLKGSG